MKKRQEKECVVIEFFSDHVNDLFPLVREIDQFNQANLHILSNDRRMTFEGRSFIRCVCTEETDAFLQHLIDTYTSGKESVEKA